MDNNSLKKACIYGYSAFQDIKSFSTNSLIVVTKGGVIIGTPVPYDGTEDVDQLASFFKKINSKILDAYRSKLNIDNDKPLPGNEGFFTLKNAKMLSTTSGTDVINFDLINIFFDDVVAFTIGKSNN